MTTDRNDVPLLPHRAPFLMVDRLLEATPAGGKAVKLVSGADPCVSAGGTLPAVFVLEALAQAGGAYLNALGGGGTHAGLLARVEGFVLHAPVRVGDELVLHVRILRRLRGTTVLEGRALVGERCHAEAQFVLGGTDEER